MFQLFDKNEDGTISVKEMLTVVHSFGFDTSEESVKNIIKHFDTDGKSLNGIKSI